MKKITLIAVCLLEVSMLAAQIPQKFSYQAVLRNSSGQALTNKSVKVRLSFLVGSETGNSVYTEEHSVVTSSQGVVTVPAGGSSTILVGSFSAIDWSAGNIWLKVEVDENLTGNFTSLGAKQLLSVPFAMYAQSGNQGPKGDMGNGISGIVDNGNGTLTINYTDGGSYITPNLKGAQGEKGDQGAPGTGLTNKGNWVQGTTYSPGDYVFATNTQQNGNAMWIVKAETSFTSNVEPRNDPTNWIEFQAPQGPPGPLVSGTIGQTLRHNGTTWIANENIFNDGINVGIGIASPTSKLDVSGGIRLRSALYDNTTTSLNAGTSDQILTSTGSGVLWKSPSSISSVTTGTGSSGQVALWTGVNSLTGLSNLSWGTSLQINSITTTDPDAPILEVKNSAGKVVFGVYQSGVRIYVEDSPIVKGAKGGFAIGGLSGSGKAGESAIYMRVTSDSSRIYIKESAAKGAKGGFAIGGLSGSGKAILSRDLMYVAPDCTRIYVNENPTKGAKGGFAIGGLSGSGKVTPSNFIQLTPSNYFIGHQSGSKTTTGLYNNFFGYQAGLSNTSGNSNVFIGYLAGNLNSSGSNNVFIGYESGKNNATGSNNVALGNNSGYSILSGSNNVLLGTNTGYSITTGIQNVLLGFESGKNTNSGRDNVFLGYHAGFSNIGGVLPSGSYNTFLGSDAGTYNATGYNNVYLGYFAGLGSSTISGTSSNNVFLGTESGKNITSGSNNVFLGYQSGYGNTTGGWNTFLGYQAGYANTTNYNLFVGYQSGYDNTSGIYNTFLGYQAGKGNTTNKLTGANNVFLGYQTGYLNSSGASNIFIGNQAGLNNSTGSNNVMLGNLAGKSNLTGGSNVLIGDQAGYNTTSSFNSFIGYQSGYDNTIGDYNTFLGYQAGKGNSVSKLTGTGNVFIGYQSGQNTSSGFSNVFIGRESGFSNSTGDNNTYIGFQSGYYGTTTQYSTFLGYQAGKGLSTGLTGAKNVFIGYNTGFNASTVQNSTFIGTESGYNSTSGSWNVFLGYRTGYNNTTGASNTFIGQEAGGTNTTGYGNVFLGGGAGNTNTTGYNNIYIGVSGGQGFNTGYHNIVIGPRWGTTLNSIGNYNVFIGSRAGINETGSKRLYIDVDGNDSNNALIYGEFDNKLIALNGTTRINKTIVMPDALEVNSYSTGNRYAYIDLHGDDTYTDFGLRLIRFNGGPNTDSELQHRGTGRLFITSYDAAPILFRTTATERMRIAPDGNVGIGNVNPTAKFHVTPGQVRLDGTPNPYVGLQDGTNQGYFEITSGVLALTYTNIVRLGITTAGNVGIGTTTPGAYKLYVAGNAYCTGTWGGSDIRWKKNIVNIGNVLDGIIKISGVKFDWRRDEFPDMNFDNETQIGFIAQDIEKVFPELVKTDNNGFKAVAYDKLSVILLEGLKEQQQQIQQLKEAVKEVEYLKAELEALKTLIKK